MPTENRQPTTENPLYVWLNHGLVPLAEAGVSVNDRGFLYGDGLFETMRAEAGQPLFLAEHLARLRQSARFLRLSWPESFSWSQGLQGLLQANGLTGTTAAIKILLTRGTIPDLGLPSTAAPTLVIYARPYAPPSPEDFAAGWPLATFPERRSTFLGRHKSLNYLFYLAARQYALDQGAKEALILESDGLVSEGSATTLVYTLNGRYFTPAAASALPSVTLTVLSRYLAQDGHELEAVPTPPDHLRQTQGLWLLNSLIGLMPVSSWDGNSLPLDPKATLYLQDCLNKAGQQDLAARCNLEL